MQPDKEEDVEFKYFYINSFKWFNPEDNELHLGHPKKGRVYRGWLNKQTNTYRIAPNLKLAFWLESLNQPTNNTGYTADIAVLTQSNILDFSIIEDDLYNLITWIESDNKDLKSALFTKDKAPPEIIALIKNGMPKIENNQFQGFVESAEELQALDPMAFEIIWGFIDYLLLEMHSVGEESFDADMLAKGPRGSVINIANAMKCLNRYAGDNRRTNNDAEDLYCAMSHITSEIIRSEVNE